MASTTRRGAAARAPRVREEQMVEAATRARGPKIFVFGRLRIHGSLMLAARFQSWFRMPGG